MAKLTVVRDPGDGPEGEFSRPPPHNIDAEQQVLGAMMLSPRAVTEVRELVDVTSFYRPAHQLIFETLISLADRGDPCEPTAVAAELGPRMLAKVGGGPYLHTLIHGVITSAQASYYAHLLRDLAYARAVVTTGTRLARAGYEAADNAAADLRGMVAAELARLSAPDVGGWADPTPLSAARDLPGFPLWTLPDWIGEYAARLAEQTQTPADLAGCLSLAVLAVAAAGRVCVRAPAWTEPTNLFTVIALGPGNRKSEVFAAMTAPIRATEKALQDQAQPLIDDLALQRKITEADLDKAEKAAMNAIDATVRQQFLAEANAAAHRLHELNVPAEPRLFSDDATPEMLASLLAQQGGRMAVLSPEGEIFSIAGGRYGGVPNFAVLKHGHTGEGMRIDRIGRESEKIETAHVTLGICTQPDVLAGLADTPQFRGQGLLGRILYAVPVSLLGDRDHNPELVPDHIGQVYAATLIKVILALHDQNEPTTLYFDDQAARAVLALLEETEPRFRPGHDLAHMPDWGGKLVGSIVRIAGLLHVARHHRGTWSQPINDATLAAAAELGGYFTAHAQAAYDMIGADQDLADARTLLDWLARTGSHRFTARDAIQALRPRFKKIADTEAGLRVLDSHGWIRRLPRSPRTAGPGRTPSTVYEVHPAAQTGGLTPEAEA